MHVALRRCVIGLTLRWAWAIGRGLVTCVLLAAFLSSIVRYFAPGLPDDSSPTVRYLAPISVWLLALTLGVRDVYCHAPRNLNKP
jgi:hypothetical protein